MQRQLRLISLYMVSGSALRPKPDKLFSCAGCAKEKDYHDDTSKSEMEYTRYKLNAKEYEYSEQTDTSISFSCTAADGTGQIVRASWRPAVQKSDAAVKLQAFFIRVDIAEGYHVVKRAEQVETGAGLRAAVFIIVAAVR
ncbi:MAG: hypothetical protein ACOC2H_05620 [Spirochaetota bacterium]